MVQVPMTCTAASFPGGHCDNCSWGTCHLRALATLWAKKPPQQRVQQCTISFSLWFTIARVQPPHGQSAQCPLPYRLVWGKRSREVMGHYHRDTVQSCPYSWTECQPSVCTHCPSHIWLGKGPETTFEDVFGNQGWVLENTAWENFWGQRLSLT